MKDYLALMFGMVFVQNFVLNQFLGICPFIGVSKKRDSAVGMGLAVIFVMGISCFVTMLVYKLVLLPLRLENYLDIISFILIIAALVQFVEIVMKKAAPDLYQALGIYLPLISTNCAVLGSTQMKLVDYSTLPLSEALLKNTALGAFGGIGFTLALYLMASIRERLEIAPVPPGLRGIPIAFLAAAGMALAFFGFNGIV
ncbi:MAG: electron transport complex subunit RsxA [Planctomycetota bacterium]|jgi:electron transport complex protein RnfA|nr:electron transport complex subunit RsxA [Planctomycetota bacterium]